MAESLGVTARGNAAAPWTQSDGAPEPCQRPAAGRPVGPEITMVATGECHHLHCLLKHGSNPSMSSSTVATALTIPGLQHLLELLFAGVAQLVQEAF